MENNRKKKTSMGRQKIEIKKIEKSSQLQVTFSKRRKGIFKKAGELGLLCGVDVAVIVASPAGKIFAFGNPSPDTVVDRFLTGKTSLLNAGEERRVERQLQQVEEQMTAVSQLEAEKVREKAARGAAGDHGFWWWWAMPVDGLGSQELEQYMAALQLLKGNVMARVNEMTVAASDGNWSSIFLDSAASTIADPSSVADGLNGYEYINYDNKPLI